MTHCTNQNKGQNIFQKGRRKRWIAKMLWICHVINHPQVLEHIFTMSLCSWQNVSGSTGISNLPLQMGSALGFSQSTHFPSVTPECKINVKKLPFWSQQFAFEFTSNLTVLQLLVAVQTVGKCFLFCHYKSLQAWFLNGGQACYYWGKDIHLGFFTLRFYTYDKIIHNFT